MKVVRPGELRADFSLQSSKFLPTNIDHSLLDLKRTAHEQ
jgi:hypothetical protein